MDLQPEIRVVAAVIRRGEKYLLCQRPTHKRHGGLWEFPGGKLESGESVLEAARRELQEELGVKVLAVGKQLCAIRDPNSVFVIEFHETTIEGDPVCLEHLALAWIGWPDLGALDLAPSDRQFVLETVPHG